MSDRLDLFPTPILKASPNNADRLNDDLIRLIREQRDKGLGIDRSNIGGWHSDTDMTRWGGDSARELGAFAVEVASGHMIDVNTGGKRQFTWAIDMWANINKPGDSNQLHCHPGAFWSGVYYPDP